jgi:hypothetical protein
MGNIKATFAQGMTEATVHGLHQWDCGRTLEISCIDLPYIVEVHFACVGMTDAIVRVGEAPLGTVTVAIPDICLEQAAPITAWVYYTDDDGGRTALTITLPIIARARPSRDYDPEDVQDSFAELSAAVNEAVDSLKEGSVTVARALAADKASEATKATKDGQGNEIAATYAKSNKPDFARWSEGSILATSCLYEFMVEVSPYNAAGYAGVAISHRDPTRITVAELGLGYHLAITPEGVAYVMGGSLTPIDEANLIGIYYRQI